MTPSLYGPGGSAGVRFVNVWGTESVVRRVVVAFLAPLLLAGLIVPAVGAAPTAAAAAPVPRVAVIVGPAGAATARYRAEAHRAAALARRYTPDVVEVYSPNATWPAVEAAVTGASVVIYLGHGNGWPSPYRDSLYPATQNGFGLNPKAGGGDGEHQYFGEAKVAGLDLADDAVVLLNHLCYASGNSEPGLAEGTPDQARQRVDNFAAGFIRAGAAAVVAEAYASPDHMLKAVLEGRRSIEASWRSAPSRNGNAFAFESARSPGFVAQMDPESAGAGFTRSIVLKAGLASADVLRGARGSAAATSRIPGLPTAPSLLAAGIRVKAPTLAATTAATTIAYRVPYTVQARDALPRTILASARWDPLDPPPGLTAVPAPDAAALVPDLGLVTPERLGDVVAPVRIKVAKKTLSFKIATPVNPGRYRLTITLHDRDGVAYDAATQALLPTVIVRVTGDLDAVVVAPAAAQLAPGAATTLDLWVANLGVGAWGHGAVNDARDPESSAPAVGARLVGHWMALDVDDPSRVAAAAAASVAAASLPPGLEPGTAIPAELGLFAPSLAGDYLLVLDILVPERGSVVAAGVEPTIIRVLVGPQVPAIPQAGRTSESREEPGP